MSASTTPAISALSKAELRKEYAALVKECRRAELKLTPALADYTNATKETLLTNTKILQGKLKMLREAEGKKWEEKRKTWAEDAERERQERMDKQGTWLKERTSCKHLQYMCNHERYFPETKRDKPRDAMFQRHLQRCVAREDRILNPLPLYVSEHKEFKICIVWMDHQGVWNPYVGVPWGHKMYDQSYDEGRWPFTFSGRDPWKGWCKDVYSPLWWFGTDHGHNHNYGIAKEVSSIENGLDSQSYLLDWAFYDTAEDTLQEARELVEKYLLAE